MTETNEPSSQPGQQQPGAPLHPNAQQEPGAPQYPSAPQYPGTQQYPQYPNPQFGAPPPGYPNPQYGNAQPSSAPYGGYGPYGNYGQYGYPYGYNAQQPGTNGMAIASLVLGICGFFCVTPFVGLGLGIAALSRIKKTGQSGRGMAIAGIILSSAWIALIVLVAVTGNFHLNIGNGSNTGPSVGPTQGANGTSA